MKFKKTRNMPKSGRSSLVKKSTLDTSIEDIMREHIYLITERSLYEKAEVLKTEENTKKDQEIDELNDRIQLLMIKNYDLDMAIEKENELRYKYEQEIIRIANYCNDIKKKFCNIETTFENYRETVERLKDENEKLLTMYDGKIEGIEKGNEKIVKRIDDRIDLFDTNRKNIADGENRIKKINEEIARQKVKFEDKKMENKIKYDNLERNISIIQGKLSNAQLKHEMEQAEKDRTEKFIKNDKNEAEDIIKEIDRFEKQNSMIQAQIEDLKRQWEEISHLTLNSSSRKKGKRSNLGRSSVFSDSLSYRANTKNSARTGAKTSLKNTFNVSAALKRKSNPLIHK